MGVMKALATRRILTGVKVHPHIGRAVDLICPYCDEPISGSSVNGLHPGCNNLMLAEVYDWEGSFPAMLED